MTVRCCRENREQRKGVYASLRAHAHASGAAHEKVMEVAKRRQRTEDGGRDGGGSSGRAGREA